MYDRTLTPQPGAERRTIAAKDTIEVIGTRNIPSHSGSRWLRIFHACDYNIPILPLYMYILTVDISIAHMNGCKVHIHNIILY